ncbi:MAG: hypothetical protein Fur0044_03640 [Anaerolineae bacterium]|nr:hypothetical protein [Anaerolineales bacterium]
MLLILFGLATGLLLIEGCLRLLGDFLPEGLRYRAGLSRFHAQMDGIYVPDPYLWHKSVAGIDRTITGHPDYDFRVQTNALGYDGIGFRDDGINDSSPIIALGDSFTWGDGIDNDKIWVERLETESGRDVVNLGMSGYGSQQILRLLQTYGLPLKPRLILWGFFPNDFNDSGHFAWREETGRLAKQAPEPKPWTETLDRELRIYSVAYTWLVSPFEEPDDNEEYERLYYTDNTLNLSFVLRSYWGKRLDPSDKYTGPGLVYTQQALAEAQTAAGQLNAELVVLLFPSKEQVYWPIVSTLADNAADFKVNWPHDEVKAWCQANGVRYLDLTPVFAAHAAQGEQLYYRFDAHWNEAGHKLAAQTIRQYLAENTPFLAASE